MKLKIEVNMDNASFGDDPANELHQIIFNQIIENIWASWETQKARTLLDSNGNPCGSWKIYGR